MTILKTAVSLGAAWTLGLAGLGVFVDTLREPQVPPPPAIAVAAAPAPLPAAAPTAAPIELAPVVIVAALPRARPAAPSESVWSCASWRDLVQGPAEQQVRVCLPAGGAGERPRL